MSVVSLQDVRDEGVTVTMASDAKVNRYIEIYEAAFNEACGQWFEERPYVVTFDGRETSVEFFQVPIIAITLLEDLGDGSQDPIEISPDDYRVYAGRNPIVGDDRRNPKIVMTNGRFCLGRQRWRATGTFGYLDENDAAPGDVHEAMLILIIEKLLTPKLADSQGILNQQLLPPNGQVVLTEEVTDDHKRKWSYTGPKQSKSSAYAGLTSNPFVISTIKKYKAPPLLITQCDWSPIEPPSNSDASVLREIYG